jgi:hypothetical protein
MVNAPRFEPRGVLPAAPSHYGASGHEYGRQLTKQCAIRVIRQFSSAVAR